MTINQQIEVAKQQYNRDLDSLRDALLRIIHSEHRATVHACEPFQALYYAQPNVTQAAGLQKRLDASCAALPSLPWLRESIAPFVAAAIASANLVQSLKAQKVTAPVTVARSEGFRYPFPTEPSFKVSGPDDIRAGDFLLVRYGNGTQLVYVLAPGRGNALSILRLYNRGVLPGSRFGAAYWTPSALRRSDPRILGRSSRVVGDPPLPMDA